MVLSSGDTSPSAGSSARPALGAMQESYPSLNCFNYYSLLILKLLNQESFNKSYDYSMLEAISFSGENRAQVEGTGAG